MSGPHTGVALVSGHPTPHASVRRHLPWRPVSCRAGTIRLAARSAALWPGVWSKARPAFPGRVRGRVRPRATARHVPDRSVSRGHFLVDAYQGWARPRGHGRRWRLAQLRRGHEPGKKPSGGAGPDGRL